LFDAAVMPRASFCSAKTMPSAPAELAPRKTLKFRLKSWVRLMQLEFQAMPASLLVAVVSVTPRPLVKAVPDTAHNAQNGGVGVCDGEGVPEGLGVAVRVNVGLGEGLAVLVPVGVAVGSVRPSCRSSMVMQLLAVLK